MYLHIKLPKLNESIKTFKKVNILSLKLKEIHGYIFNIN